MNIYILIYIAAISFFAVVLTVWDKTAARKSKRRIRERTLLAVSVLGGSATMLLTMLAVRHKTRHKKFMIGIPIIIIAQVATIIFVFDSRLTISRYDIETAQINGQVKLMLVTDLHSCDYGEGQIELIDSIEAENPDAVLLCGDIFDDNLSEENTVEFIKAFSKKYRCYYVTGNHEIWSGQADNFKDILESYGVKVLEGTSEVLEVGEEKIRISGLDDPDTDRYASRSISYAEQIANLQNELADSEIFTILLSHHPERIDELLLLNPALVLSGHAHGGQWRLPVLLENGLYSPNQGLFPKYTNGQYHFEDTELIVSRGLARESTRLVPRIFNHPEIVIITLN